MCFLSLTASNIEWGDFSTFVEMTVRQEGAWQLGMCFYRLQRMAQSRKISRFRFRPSK